MLALHSYSGVLAGPVVERADGRIRAVAYLGAFLTASGESLLDVEPDDTADPSSASRAPEGLPAVSRVP